MQVYDTAGLRVDVSTKGRVKFMPGEGAVEGEPAVLTTVQIMDLCITLATAFESKDVEFTS